VRVFSATQEHDIRFHQVHAEDGGRIKMKRTCSIDGEEVAYDQLAKGYESPDGRLVILTDEDFENLPLSTSREIDVVEFVPAEQVDPILFNRTYYLEPEARAAKPYQLLREALTATDRMAVVKVALRQRETLAVLRVREKVIVLQTLLWPDEVRAADFELLDSDVEVRPQELAMAQSLVESLAADFAPEQFEDSYTRALSDLVEAKLEGAEPAPAAAEDDTDAGEVVDLLTALQRSVERARQARGEAPAGSTCSTGSAGSAGSTDGTGGTGGTDDAAQRTPVRKAAATKTAARSAAKKAPAKKAAAAEPAKKAPAKKAAAKTRKSA
jgi:DNA end-binding protein Ku